jgi:hypothetical protein
MRELQSVYRYCLQQAFRRAPIAGSSNRSGQAMLMSVLSIGGVLLGATTIAGILMVFQIRQNTDFANSAKAIYAADAGLEWGLYNSGKNVGAPSPTPLPTFSNGATLVVKCYDASEVSVTCTDPSVVRVRGVGESARSSRALEANF